MLDRLSMENNNNIRIVVLSAWLLIIGMSAYLLFSHLGANTPFYPDEALYDISEIRMVNEDGFKIFPSDHTDLDEYFKPPLKNWLQYPVLKVFGISGFTLRAVSAVMALISVILVMLIAAELYNPLTGSVTGFIFITFFGMYRDYWGRLNGYDTGFAMFSLLFLYLYIKKFDHRLGAVFCGFALAGAFYFKHIQSFLPLLIVTIHLISKMGFRYLFSRKYIGMISVFVLLVSLWHIPFFLVHSEKFAYFLDTEIYQRIITGFRNQSGYNESFKHLIDIEKITGDWYLWILPATLLFAGSGLKKKSREHFLVALWFFIPLFLLSLSASRLTRYMFAFYPALAIITGFSLIKVFKILLTKWRSKRSNILRHVMLIVFSLAVTITAVNSFQHSMKVVKPYHKSNLHILIDSLSELPDGRLLITQSDRKEYSWTEQVVMSFIPEQVVIVDVSHPDDFLKKIRNNDVLLISRWELTKMLTEAGKSILNPEGLLYLKVPRSKARYNSLRKVALFPLNGGVCKILERENLPYENFSELCRCRDTDTKSFIQNLFAIAFGIKHVNQIHLKYYILILGSS